VWTLVKPDLAFAGLAGVRPGLLTRQQLSEPVRGFAVHWNAHVALPTMPWLPVATRETHPRPGVTRARAGHLGPAPTLAYRRHARNVATGTDSKGTHLRDHSEPENAPGDALGGTRIHPDRVKRRALDQLRTMGYNVTLSPLEAASG